VTPSFRTDSHVSKLQDATFDMLTNSSFPQNETDLPLKAGLYWFSIL